MRIKRFIAADMRTALGMVRAEHGPEAVILSTRPTADGIEVVAATDYDEALVNQALRAATPGLAPAGEGVSAAGYLLKEAPVVTDPPTEIPAAASNDAPPRDSFARRARAVFGIGDAAAPAASRKAGADATLAELTAGFPTAAAAAVTPTAPRAAARPLAPAPAHFQAMMAAMVDTANAASVVADSPRDAAPEPTVAPTRIAETQSAAAHAPRPSEHVDSASAGFAPPAAGIAAEPAPSSPDHPTPPADEAVPAVAVAAAKEALGPDAAPASEPATATPAAPVLQAVPDPDPDISAMREELTSMRRMIEREMGQFTTERLRGSPARAAAYDILLGYGCDESLAQSVVAKLNPALPPDQVRAPMLAELARMLTVLRSEPIDEGGVIALIGPTGAGKTTTVAKLAARFAARHRARDVAMVTTDTERLGAIEQLHAHGRRMGITVCEARGAESLTQTLEQLQDYPLVLVDTAGYGSRDRALLGQITWLRATRQLRSLLVMPANAHPHDLNELVRRYRIASPEAVVLTKTDETGRLGAALSVAVRNGLSLAYTTHGQLVPGDLQAANASNLVLQLEKLRRAADNPFVTEDEHANA
ncbi:flagellar biosynthesis protein FlhF [Lysobacter sp. H21R4]|uniref:flagellar biosynthesis protein FlhF n=1 Tax=Lysobacter sp. H21R4 TaxID=2781021 RepID=UPI001886C53D|nr:flagellar biosynthesis protein FlhF [Lysobacter sp. H21R4]QOY63326.1 flagellar biosynthesis protein FlhF [Lysobacter sp. H21R4]